MALAQKVDNFVCNAEDEKRMLNQAPSPYVPTKQELEEADKVLNLKKSKHRKAPSDILAKLARVYSNEGGAMLGH